MCRRTTPLWRPLRPPRASLRLPRQRGRRLLLRMDSMPSAWPPPWNQYRRQNDSDAPAARREPDIADRASPEAPAATASAASQPIQIPNSIAAESSFCTPPPAPSEAAAAATAAGSVPLPPYVAHGGHSHGRRWRDATRVG
ncbi:hypothetical protein PLESTM_001840900 [Pleodorina starrii]|nr:hypothetical protein PLESTM_001840900 [Pleodorina starrii]